MDFRSFVDSWATSPPTSTCSVDARLIRYVWLWASSQFDANVAHTVASSIHSGATFCMYTQWRSSCSQTTSWPCAAAIDVVLLFSSKWQMCSDASAWEVRAARAEKIAGSGLTSGGCGWYVTSTAIFVALTSRMPQISTDAPVPASAERHEMVHSLAMRALSSPSCALEISRRRTITLVSLGCQAMMSSTSASGKWLSSISSITSTIWACVSLCRTILISPSSGFAMTWPPAVVRLV